MNLAHYVFIAMSEPNICGALIGAALSSSNVVRKRACVTQSKGQKRQTTIAKTLRVPRNSTTSLGFSKRGLPAQCTAKATGAVKPTADTNWVLVPSCRIGSRPGMCSSGSLNESTEQQPTHTVTVPCHAHMSRSNPLSS